MPLTDRPSTRQDIADQLIRDLVDQHPDVMTVLSPYGLDLCCGGGHPLGEALDLHGIPREPAISEVTRIVEGQAGDA